MLYEKDFVSDTHVIVSDSGYSDVATSIAANAVAQPEKTDLEMPVSIWVTMFASYAVFFAGLIAATGRDGGTIFVIIISILYTLMYFGVASVLFNQNRPEQIALFARGLGPLITYTGPMDRHAVVGQILTIPLCLALFGIVMAVYRAMIFG